MGVIISKKKTENKIVEKHLYNMPEFVSNDPVVEWMDWKKGNIIGICEDKCLNEIFEGECCKNTRYRIVV